MTSLTSNEPHTIRLRKSHDRLLKSSSNSKSKSKSESESASDLESIGKSKLRNQKPQSNRFKPVLIPILSVILTICCFAYLYHRPQAISNQSPFSSDPNLSSPVNTFKRYPLPKLPYEAQALSDVKKAIKDSWLAYANNPAWGSDNFHAISGTGDNLTQAGSIGFFIVDVLDTILLTGEMQEEYERARRYVERDLHFEVDGHLNAFETTIRVLGGLLSVYHLSGNDHLYLEKAIDLGTRLLPIFNSPTGIPYSFINLKTGKASADQDNNGYSSLAEATTLQLEFKYLAELSGRREFWDVAEKAMMPFKEAPSHNGLFPILVSPIDASFFFHIRLGSRGDSYYEYLIKQYLQTNRTQTVYKDMYEKAMTGVREELVRETPGGLVYVGELHPAQASYQFVPKQDHLVCFLGGLLLYGVTEGVRPFTKEDVAKLSDETQENWMVGKELIHTCVNTYERSATGLGAEIVEFKTTPEQLDPEDRRDWLIPHYNRLNPPLDARNILRPETVESLFFAWRATKDPIYREWGWQIFQAFNEHCKVKETGAFASILDVDQLPVKMENRMETFWLAETLKYLMLLFSEDSVIPLDSYVFNTEAHILPIFTPTFRSHDD